MRKVKIETKLKGFSIFELLIIIGILILLSSFVFPLSIQKVQENKLKNYVSELLTDIYFQQQESYYKNSPKGVSFTSNGYTLFDGESLASATSSDYIDYPANISLSSISFDSGNELYFPPGEFKPLNPGGLTFSDGFNSIDVFINKEGLIEYDIY